MVNRFKINTNILNNKYTYYQYNYINNKTSNFIKNK